MNIAAYKTSLTLKQVFTTSHGSVSTRDGIFVEIEQDGIRGYGEAIGVQYYGMSQAVLVQQIAELSKFISHDELTEAEQIYEELQRFLPEYRFAICALDEAAHDWCAKRDGKPLYKQLGLDKNDAPVSTLTIGIMSPEEAALFVEQNPWPAYKIKLGTDQDQEIIEAIRSKTEAPLRIDANSGWTLSWTAAMDKFLQQFGVEFIEQPLPAGDTESIRQLRQQCSLPVIADESCQTEADLEFCLEHYDGINIKLMKCGGITPAIRMIQKARELDRSVMLGCMTESSVGISCGCHIASLVDFVDLDGALLISNDPAEGVQVHANGYHFPNRPGHGAQLSQHF